MDKADVFIDAIFISKFGNCSLYYVLFFRLMRPLNKVEMRRDSSLALYIF